MTAGWMRWPIEIALFAGATVGTHLIMSCGQTLMHRWLGHHRIGGVLFRNHINFHHARYAKGHLTSDAPETGEGNNTPYFFLPVLLAWAAAYRVLPLVLFIAVTVGAGASFYAHVWLDKAYHAEGSYLERFGWFQRMRRLHFVHHLHANANFAVVDFFWDRFFGTYRQPSECGDATGASQPRVIRFPVSPDATRPRHTDPR